MKLISNNVIERFKRGKRVGSINNTSEGLKVQKLQTLLNSLGKGKYNLKVDGYWGKNTQAAYDDFMNNHSGLLTESYKKLFGGREFNVQKNSGTQAQRTVQNQSQKKEPSKLMTAMVKAAERTNKSFGGYQNEQRVIRGKQANNNDNVYSEKLSKPVEIGLNLAFPFLNLGTRYNREAEAFDKSLHTTQSNAYPYSYGDMLVNDKGDMIPYSRFDYPDGIPAGYRLTQVSANTPKDIQVKAMRLKIQDALKGKDPRKEFMEQIANINLSTPEGMQQYRELIKNKPQGFIRVTGNPINDQFEIRARLAASGAFDNNGEQPTWFNEKPIWEINPDFDSPTAKARGRATYRIRDPKQRERIYGEMRNYFLKHSDEGHWKDDDPNSGVWILNNMGFMGNQSLVADNPEGLNLRFGDYWDYAVNPSNGYVMYMGDRLVPEGTTPKRYAYGQTGHNSAAMSEIFDGNYAKEIAKDYISELVPNYEESLNNYENTYNKYKEKTTDYLKNLASNVKLKGGGKLYKMYY